MIGKKSSQKFTLFLEFLFFEVREWHLIGSQHVPFIGPSCPYSSALTAMTGKGWDPSYRAWTPPGLPSVASHSSKARTLHFPVHTWSCEGGGGNPCYSQHTMAPTGHSSPPNLKSIHAWFGGREGRLN